MRHTCVKTLKALLHAGPHVGRCLLLFVVLAYESRGVEQSGSDAELHRGLQDYLNALKLDYTHAASEDKEGPSDGFCK
jgi:hypothetical protein